MSSLYTRLKITLGKANADQHALESMQSDDQVVVTEGKDIIFRPKSGKPAVGVILYPGGRCDPHAYAPVLKPLAAAGALVIVPHMPLRLAVMDANRAAKIMAVNSEPDSWIIGGHSMGGAMAAAWAYKNPGAIEGLFFLASYPSSMHAMPDSNLPVAMIYGTHDYITRKSEFEASYERLPQHADFIAIEGGDHYQFGSFGNVQVTATKNRDQQQDETIRALQSFISKFAG
ncbi:MAG: alpha/beta fold hydrolase [Gammaproteobacteria bacterium]